MSTTANRIAAKAYADEKRHRLLEEARMAAIMADLEPLKTLRRYLILDLKAKVPAQALIDALDDYAERLTGDRRALHLQNHSIG